ncbi:MAG TPA: CBS domain-containing protein [Gammaproteobacteria bacterium]|nr:CBS domain-containing protein [Gammaproteobacteria bacterium]
MLVRDIMTPGPVTVPLDASVDDARRLLEEHGFHHLPVVGPAGLEGIVSDRDVLRYVSPFLDTPSERDRDLYTLRRPIHQIMTRQPVTVSPDDTVRVAAAEMLRADVGCMPVVGVAGLAGLVTRKDLLRALITGDTAR